MNTGNPPEEGTDGRRQGYGVEAGDKRVHLAARAANDDV
jgi:hypothetical protein